MDKQKAGRRLIAIQTSAGLSALAFLMSNAQAIADDDFLNKRIHSAQKLIGQSERYQSHASQLHKQLTVQIAQAEKLKGEARVLRTNLPSTDSVHLSGAELKAARTEFAQHINAFKAHAATYQSHLEKFNTQVGACHNNDREFQLFAEENKLHTDIFHINDNDIKPPHICGALKLSDADAKRLAELVRSDQQRLVHAETALLTEEQKLSNAELMSQTLNGKVLQHAERAQAEKEIFGEFGRLRTEYELLKTENEVIKHNGKTATITSTSVQAKLHK